VPGRRQVPTLIAAALLAAPGGALAQSAGDEQYQDPFGADEPAQSDQRQSAPQSGASPAQPGSQPAPSGSQPAAEGQAGQQGVPELANTGSPVALLAAGGALLLAAGLLLRRRLS
jgi:LPXTG-motif cell wall-anchored protein